MTIRRSSRSISKPKTVNAPTKNLNKLKKEKCNTNYHSKTVKFGK